jgi:AraC-like DNA-binding protein
MSQYHLAKKTTGSKSNFNKRCDERTTSIPKPHLKRVSETLKTKLADVTSGDKSAFREKFNDFVNERRVAAFKDTLAKATKQNYTLLAVALDYGFNSKATFSRKLTGLSPRDTSEQTHKKSR